MKRKDRKRNVWLANEMIRPSIWTINPRKNLELEKRFQTFSYKGNDNELKIVLKGFENYNPVLYEEDRGVLLCLLEIANEMKSNTFELNLADIAKKKGVKNPYCDSVIEPIFDSIDRLLNIHIRIRTTKKRGFTFGTALISGYIESNCFDAKLSITPYTNIVNDLLLGKTPLSVDEYYNLRSHIARSLYSHLQSTQPFYNGQVYKIRLSKLLKTINYPINNRRWFEIWPHIERALKELKSRNYCDYKRNAKYYKQEGGMISIWKVKQVKADEKATGKQQTKGKLKESNELKTVKEWFDLKDFDSNQLQKLEANLNQFKEKMKNYTTIGGILENYLKFLKEKEERGDVKYISASLFTTENPFFKDFWRLEHDQLNNITEREQITPPPQKQQETKSGQTNTKKHRKSSNIKLKIT